MKKTKFAVLLTAFMAVLGLSSCLGEPDPFVTYTEIMKVEGFMGLYSFKSSAGYTVEPTNSNVITSTLDANYAYVTYKYDTRTLDPSSDKIDAEIQYLLPINELEYNYNNFEDNAAMHTVSSSIKFFDKTNIFIDLTYFYERTSDDELTEELAKHSFYLRRATAEEDEDVADDVIVLYLTHNVTDVDNNENRKSIGTETRHFDLNYVLQGSKPEKIIIKFKQNTSSINVDDNVKDSEVEIEYKEIVDTYFPESGSNI